MPLPPELEAVDLDAFPLLEACSCRRSGVSALVLRLGRRRLGRKAELLLGMLQKIGNVGDGLRLALFGVLRLGRPGVERRLLQHVVVERDGSVAGELPAPLSALLGDSVPIGRRAPVEGAARLLVGGELLAINGDLRREVLIRGLGARWRGAERAARRRQKGACQDNCAESVPCRAEQTLHSHSSLASTVR